MDIHIYPSKDNRFRATCCNSSISLFVSGSIPLIVNEVQSDPIYKYYDIVVHTKAGNIDYVVKGNG
jgi:hypothetical protein